MEDHMDCEEDVESQDTRDGTRQRKYTKRSLIGGRRGDGRERRVTKPEGGHQEEDGRRGHQ